jgi:hypothetical protein
MSGWTSRRDGRGATTFISYSASDIELLLPPGVRLAVEPAGGGVKGSGLWIHARWTRSEEPMVELDAPRWLRRIRTAAVVAMVGEELRGEVAALMGNQLAQAWMLCEPRGHQPLEDRRAHKHAALLMSLTDEVSEAFPRERFWQLTAQVDARTAPLDFDGFLLRLCDTTLPREAPDDPALSTRLVARALLRIMWTRVSRRRSVTASQLLVWVGRPRGSCAPTAVVTHSRSADERPVLAPPVQ